MSVKYSEELIRKLADDIQTAVENAVEEPSMGDEQRGAVYRAFGGFVISVRELLEAFK